MYHQRRPATTPSRQAALQTAQWLWIMPTLLLRRVRLEDEDGGGALTDQIEADTKQTVPMQDILRRRLSLAEAGQWRALLCEYIDDREAARAAEARRSRTMSS